MFARIIALLAAISGLTAVESTVFTSEVLPIFDTHCVSCHGPERQRAGLRLDTAVGTLAGGNSGPVLVAGHPERSRLLQLVTLPPDHDDIMPPKGDPLTAAQVGIIRAWIATGAEAGGVAALPPPPVMAPQPTAFEQRATTLTAPDPAIVQRFVGAGGVVRGLDPAGHTLEINLSRATVDLVLLESLKRIAPNVVWLDLGGLAIGDAELATLKPLSALEKLDLRHTAVSDQGLIHLINLKELRFLTLVGTQVSDAGLFRLYGLKNLERVYLWGSRATAEGGKRLTANIPGCVANTGP